MSPTRRSMSRYARRVWLACLIRNGEAWLAACRRDGRLKPEHLRGIEHELEALRVDLALAS